MASPRLATAISLLLHASAISVGVIVCADAIAPPRKLRIEIQHRPDIADFPDEARVETPVEVEESTPNAHVPDVVIPPQTFDEPAPVDPTLVSEVRPLPPPPSLAPFRKKRVVAVEQAREPLPLLVEAPVREPAPIQVEPVARTLTVVPGQNPRPDYPTSARRRGWQGEVLILVDVDALGAVSATAVLVSSGHDILDQAALAAARQWRFADGPGRAEIPFEFRLR